MTVIPPCADEDSFDVLDDALSALARRRGLYLGDEVVLIHLLASLIEAAQRCLPEEVSIARANGASWAEIATLLATSPDEARCRFDPASPIADGRWALDP